MSSFTATLIGGILFILGLIIMLINPLIGFSIFLIGSGILFFQFFVKKYNAYERGIIFRMGKFNRIVGPGWAIVIPFFEKEYSRIDVRTKMLPLFIPTAFTKDDLRLKINGTVYYRIVNPAKATLAISNYLNGLQDLIVSEVRNVIGSMSMRELFANLAKLNDMLRDAIRHSTWQWGIDVPMVQIKSVMPPEEIAQALQSPFIASQELQAQRFRAEARKVVIQAIGDAAKNLDDKAIMYLYLKALEELSKGSATKIVFPMQFMSILQGMEGNVGKALAGLNLSQAINAVKGVIQSSS